jgi:adenylate kinase
MRLIILGPPGAGKGTQAAKIAAEFGIPAISTGDIFRANIKNETPLGLQVKEVLSSGGYVTDEITNAIVRDRLFEADAEQGFLLDGYPRTAPQVDALDAILAEHDVVQRLLKRAEEQGRDDDTEEVIRERQAIYRRETAPLTEVYSGRGLLVQVDGMGTVDEVFERITAALRGAAAS